MSDTDNRKITQAEAEHLLQEMRKAMNSRDSAPRTELETFSEINSGTSADSGINSKSVSERENAHRSINCEQLSSCPRDDFDGHPWGTGSDFSGFSLFGDSEKYADYSDGEDISASDFDKSSIGQESHDSNENCEVLIPCWPHGRDEASSDKDAESHVNDVKTIVTCFGVGWLVLFVIFHFHSFNYWIFQTIKLVAISLVPFYCLFRGLSHLSLSERGIEFLSNSLVSKRTIRFIEWSELTRIYLDKTGKKSILDHKICFQRKKGRTIKVKLSKIANSKQWQRLIDAINKWSLIDTEGLERNLFDVFNHDRCSPTFTMLWLEAMSAPPKRERLHPLSCGMTLRQGRYKICAEIGSGGQGRAYLAEGHDYSNNNKNSKSSINNPKVVLKEYILPLYVDRNTRMNAIKSFESEAAILTSLEHPSIVRLLDFFIDDHRAYHVLEYIEGMTVKDKIDEAGPLDETRLSQYAEELASILAYLHEQTPPIVHGDFTPDNIMIGVDGRLKLIDFMAASKVCEQANTSMSIVGKPSYMAPEQFSGRLSTRSDIYALGCTLYYMSVGHEPEPLNKLFPILENENISLYTNDLISRCTDQDPICRPQSASSIIRELREKRNQNEMSSDSEMLSIANEFI